MIHKSMTTLALAFMAGLCAAPQALAQDALGTGRGLERDLRIGGTGNTPAKDFGAEVRMRNAIITGNAPGGMAFRGGVPYRDPAEFQGALGGTGALFSFRRDTLFSGLGGSGYRGTEGLQYQLGLSTGGTRGLTLSRDSAVAAQATGLTTTDRAPTAGAWKIASLPTGALRSTGAYAGTRSLSPVEVGEQRVGDERRVMAASELLGLRGLTPEKPEWERIPGAIEPPEAPKPTSSASAATPRLGAQPAFDSRTPKTAQRTNASVRTAFDDLLDRLHETGDRLPAKAPTPKATEPTTTQPSPQPGTTPGAPVTRDRQGPVGGTSDALTRAVTPEPTKQPVAGGWEARMNELRDALARGQRTRVAAKPGESGARLDVETLRAIRQAGHAAQATTLVPTAPKWRDFFVEQMKAGEENMKTERYFDAEERFSRALSLRPGEASAMAARINAQLASGLLVSASINLRTLVREHPDALGMTFAGPLLPTAPRQESLLRQLRDNLKDDPSKRARAPLESALLLAYLGYQRSEPSVVREGLDALQRESAGADAALIEFLRGVWLAEEAPSK